jgi:PST family polysaccharide transporter
LLGDAQLGFYQMAYTLMTYPLANFCQVIAAVAYPAFSALQDDNERLRAAFTRVSVTVGFFSIPAMLGLMVVADPFVRVVLGQKWGPVTGLMLVFAPLGALQSIYGLVGAIYNAKGRSDRLFQWSVMSGGFYVISFLVGVRWGIQGVAIAYSVTWLLGMVPGFLIPFRLIHLSGKEFLRAMWPGTACAAAMALITLAWRLALNRLGFRNPAVHLFTTVAAGVISYAVLMWWWNPPVVEEVCDVLASRGLSRLTPLISRRRWAAAKSSRMFGDC